MTKMPRPIHLNAFDYWTDLAQMPERGHFDGPSSLTPRHSPPERVRPEP
jgi:hypothetical protein